VDRWSDYPPRVRNLPQVGSDLHIDLDCVLALQPELVVASLHVPGMEDNLPLLEGAGVPYLAVGGVGLAGVWEDVRVIGQYLNREARAAALVQQAQARFAAVERVCGAASQRPRVHWEWAANPIVAGRRSWITEMLHLAGGENAYADLDVESVRLTLEDVASHRPDVVVACWCGARKLPTPQRLLDRKGWQDIKAVQSGRVAVFDESLFGRPGPRLADGLERLAHLLHPEFVSALGAK
jgi:iron complex transport system substrate-binding protein